MRFIAATRTHPRRLRRACLAVLAAGVGLPASPSPAAVFEYLANRVDVSPVTTGSWVDVDVSASIPAGATGVLLEMVGSTTLGNDWDWGCRKNGSTDTWMIGTGHGADDLGHGFFMVGVDSNRVFELYQGSTQLKTYLLGYTKAGATFLTNAVDKSVGSNNTWTDIDISADTEGSTAIGAIFILWHGTTTYRHFGMRKKGSTDNRDNDFHYESVTMGIIGVDNAEVCQFRTEVASEVKLYLVGYVTSGAVFFTNGIDKSTGTTGSYVDVDITANIGTDDANGALVEVISTTDDAVGYLFARYRPKGASWDQDGEFTHTLFPVGIDSTDIFQQRIANTAYDLFLIGYTLAGPAAPSITSAANQTFDVGGSPTAISQITITDPEGGQITAANDLRVRIPAGFNMTWDTADTTAAIGGTAAGKVSTTVSYEDAGATLVLNVTSSFSLGENVTVSGLSFTSFTAASSADTLELEVYNDGAVTGTDTKTITIIAPPTACGSPFCYLDTPVNITPSTAGSWQDVDVSTYVPSGATGVILLAQGDGAANRNYGVRKNGSSDAWMPTGNNLVSTQQQMYMIGVDSNQILEVYTAGTAVKTWLVGYTMSGVSFFTNAVNKSLASIATPVDINISADTGADTAIGAIFIVKNTGASSYNYFLRKNGSTDNRYLNALATTTLGAMIGVDGSEICEMQIANVAVDAYLVGYVTSGAVFFTNGTNKSTGTTASYVDVDITSDIGSDNANGAIVEWGSTDNTTRNWALRSNGATYDYYLGYRHLFGIVAIDSGDIFEQKISTTVMDLYLIGYTLQGSPLSISSDEDQVFEVDDPPTSASAFTITDAPPAEITSTDDIRIRIPGGFNMTWNPSVTSATFSGTAAAKVSAAVTYEDSDATLVLNVTSDFADGDTLVVSGLGFTGFSASSAQDNLELDADDDGTADATDDKAIQIGPSGTTYYVRKTGNDSANGLTPATAWLTIGKAAATLVAGDWVYVGAGVYDQGVSPANDGTSANRIRYLGDTGGAKTGDAGTVEITDSSASLNVVWVNTDNYIEFARFTITGGDITVRWENSTGGRLTNCELAGGTGRGVRTYGTAQLAITGCHIHDCANAGIRVADSSSVTVSDTLIHDNASTGVRDDPGSTGTLTLDRCEIHSTPSAGGIYGFSATYLITNCLVYGIASSAAIHLDADGPTMTIWHSTIDGNSGAGILVEGGTLTLRNSIISNNQQAGLDVSGGTADHTYNIFWNNSPDFSGTSEHATERSDANPLFTSPSDRHLQATLPAVDAGTDASAVTIVDFDGDARPAAGGWDIGYDEQGSATGTPRILSWREVEPN